MPRSIVLSVLLIDIGLVVERVLTLPGVFTLPGFNITIGSVALSFVAAGVFIIGADYSKVLPSDLRLATATGAAGGLLMIVHMALENFGARVGEDWRITVAVMVGTFALWFSSGWLTGRNRSNLVSGVVAGCWTALVSVILAVTFGLIGMYFDVPSSAYVATWPEYVQSGASDPQAFAIANTLDAATSHLVAALLLGSILGGAGWCCGSLQSRHLKLRQ